MPTTSTKHLTTLLNGLALRARKGDAKPDLSPAIPLVNDLSRLVVRGKASDIRTAQAAVAGVREQLEYGDAANTPLKALTGINSHAYLAGAMWALNEFMTVRLNTMPPVDTKGRVTRKSRIQDLVLSAMISEVPATPRSILDSVEAMSDDDFAPRFDEVSRALSDLVAQRLVETKETEPGTDRRTKYQYTLTVEGGDVFDNRIATNRDTVAT